MLHRGNYVLRGTVHVTFQMYLQVDSTVRRYAIFECQLFLKLFVVLFLIPFHLGSKIANQNRINKTGNK